MTLILASNNAGKLDEMRTLLNGVSVISPTDIGLNLDVEESGQTFAANAELKAHAYAAASGQIAIADDSGLEVDALDGAPGGETRFDAAFDSVELGEGLAAFRDRRPPEF